MTELKYIGNGVTVKGIPGRDLTAQEVELWGREWLLSTHLYEQGAEEGGKAEPIAFEYIGQGAFVPGIPARHLTLKEAEACTEGQPEKLLNGEYPLYKAVPLPLPVKKTRKSEE